MSAQSNPMPHRKSSSTDPCGTPHDISLLFSCSSQIITHSINNPRGAITDIETLKNFSASKIVLHRKVFVKGVFDVDRHSHQHNIRQQHKKPSPLETALVRWIEPSCTCEPGVVTLYVLAEATNNNPFKQFCHFVQQYGRHIGGGRFSRAPRLLEQKLNPSPNSGNCPDSRQRLNKLRSGYPKAVETNTTTRPGIPSALGALFILILRSLSTATRISAYNKADTSSGSLLFFVFVIA